MFFHEIVQTLRRVEARQQEILERLNAQPPGAREEFPQLHAGALSRGDEWMQKGIDNILAYEAGKKREG